MLSYDITCMVVQLIAHLYKSTPLVAYIPSPIMSSIKFFVLWGQIPSVMEDALANVNATVTWIPKRSRNSKTVRCTTSGGHSPKSIVSTIEISLTLPANVTSASW